MLCGVLAAMPGGAYADEPADNLPATAWHDRATAAAAAMREARERRLRDEQRAVEGRLRAIDRKLDVREFLHSRETRPVPPDGVPGPLQDPVAERLKIERRGLRDRDRLLEQRLRNEHFDRERVRRMRSW